MEKSTSQWVKPYNWGWVIQPFKGNETLKVAVVKDPNDSVLLDEPVRVMGFPKISKIMLPSGREVSGGLALWRDSDGQIHVIQDKADEKRFPWRQ